MYCTRGRERTQKTLHNLIVNQFFVLRFIINIPNVKDVSRLRFTLRHNNKNETLLMHCTQKTLHNLIVNQFFVLRFIINISNVKEVSRLRFTLRHNNKNETLLMYCICRERTCTSFLVMHLFFCTSFFSRAQPS